MLARPDRPLRSFGAVKTAKASKSGRMIVAIEANNKPWRHALDTRRRNAMR